MAAQIKNVRICGWLLLNGSKRMDMLSNKPNQRRSSRLIMELRKLNPRLTKKKMPTNCKISKMRELLSNVKILWIKASEKQNLLFKTMSVKIEK